MKQVYTVKKSASKHFFIVSALGLLMLMASTIFAHATTSGIVQDSIPNYSENQEQTCSPLSTLVCEDLVVSLPVSYDFSTSISGTLSDSQGVGTGFTAALEHSEARRTGDLPVSNPQLNGYEPSLITLTNNTLKLVSQAGISYLAPPQSSNNNNQVNTLGVGLQNLNRAFTIESEMLNIVTGSGSAQAGIWFGTDEDNFVKLNVSGNNVELRREVAGNSNNTPGSSDQILAENAGVQGQNVKLKMLVDPIANTITAYYAVNGGTYTQLTKSSLTEVQLPATYISGRTINETTQGVTFAGIYATHRNGTQFTTEFNSFKASYEPLALEFTPKLVDIKTAQGTLPREQIVAISATSGNPSFSLSDDPNSGDWLILPKEPVLGNLNFGFKEDLPVGIYNTTLFAIPADSNYETAQLEINLEVTDTLQPTTGFSFVEDFNSYGSGNLHELAQGSWTKEGANDAIIPILTEGMTENTSFSLDMSRGTQTHDYQSIIDNPEPLVAGDPFYFATYFNVSNLGTGSNDRIRTVIRIDDEVAGDQWIREQIIKDGDSIAARIGLQELGSNQGTVPIAKNKTIQFITRGVWDGINTITYSWSINPRLNERTTDWIPAGTHTVEGTPQVGRLFVSSLGQNNGRLSAVRLSNDYEQVVTEFLGQLNPAKLVFSHKKITADVVSGGDHPYTENLSISNTGELALADLAIELEGVDAGDFAVGDIPERLEPAETVNIDITFNPQSNGPKYAMLHVSAPEIEETRIPLSGLGKTGAGGSDEPSLQWILDTQLGQGVIHVGDNNPRSNRLDVTDDAYNQAQGDELLIDQFKKASSGPVSLEVLGVYGPEDIDPITAFGWYVSGDSTSMNEIFTVSNTISGNGQTLNPQLNGATSFDPGLERFGFYSRWPFFNNRVLYSEDALNSFDGAIPHHVRVYPLPGEEHAYIIALEEHISGFDYQDIILIARNIKPAGDPEAACNPISTLACDNMEVSVPFTLSFEGSAGGLSDTGFTMVDNPSTRIPGDGPVSYPEVPGYEPGRISLSNGQLILDAAKGLAFTRNGTGEGTSTDVNSQINSLGVGLNVSSSEILDIKTTLAQPYNDASQNHEQAGLWFGLDEDNYAKLVVINGSSVQLLTEVDGVSDEDTQNIQLDGIPGLHNGTVTLRLKVDPEMDQLTAYYALNGGAESIVGSLPLPSSFAVGKPAYNGLSFAGLFASKRREEATKRVAYAFNDFEISREEDREVSFEPVNINFSDLATAAPAGYEKDNGAAFGNRSNGYTYGWLNAATDEPADLNSNSRRRNVSGVNILNSTLIHMQYGDISDNAAQGFLPNAKWEIEVPGGTYSVSVAVGDPNVDNSADIPKHSINVEGISLINRFSPTGSAGEPTRFTSAKTTVIVTDGKLTLNATGGFNTKINSVSIAQIAPREVPYFTSARPADGAVNVPISSFQIALGLVTPEGYELDKNTTRTARLFEVTPTGELLVPTNSNDTGGGDSVILSPTSPLKPFTTYVLRTSGSVEANRIGDLSDRIPFEPFETRFTTGDGDGMINQPGRELTDISFTKVRGEALGEGVQYERFSSMQIGPDGKLYASTIGDFQSDGKIFRWDMETDGTLRNLQVMSPELHGANDPVTGSPQNNDTRLIIGFRFDPNATADNLVAYITHSKSSESDGPEWDGVLTRLSGTNFENVQDLIIHLPRSKKDHLTNSIAFDPAGDMYISQGSNTAGGEPDPSWALRPERLLSGAVLKIELDKLPANLPLDAFTTDDIDVINNAPTNAINMSDGTYNPYAENSPVSIFATGIRNAYDLVWHSNGWLYIPTNGTAGNNRNSPNSPSTADYQLARRIDGRDDIPDVPALVGGNTQKDWLFKTKGGSYHGHPNPYRGEFVLNHGGASYSGIPGQINSSDIDVPKYPTSVVPDPNYMPPAYDFNFNKSPNGVIEYKSEAFGGKLKGLIMVVQFSGQDDVLLLDPGSNGDIAYDYHDVTGLDGFDDPIELVEDPRTGNIYVSEYDRDGSSLPQLTLLRASDPARPRPIIATNSESVHFETTVNRRGVQKQTRTVEVTNDGSENLVITSAAISGAYADQFETLNIEGEQTLLPGESLEYSITYAPALNQSNIGYQSAQLVISSNDEELPELAINLDALKKKGYEGRDEPDLQDVLYALGMGIDAGWDYLAYGVDPAPVGDEVEVERWVKLDAGTPIVITPVGRYSPAESLPFGWFTNDGEVVHKEIGILQDGIDHAQSLYPPMESGEKTVSFDPEGAVFGFYVESKSFDRYNYTQAEINTDGVPHRTRIYPNKTRAGELIPNSYLITFEDASNGDYQDYMFIIDNVIAFGDAELNFDFDKEELAFTASSSSEAVASQELTLTASGAVTAEETQLEATESWIVLPKNFKLGSPFEIGIDVSNLSEGEYDATITASAPNYSGASIPVHLNVTNEIVYVYQFNFQDPENIADSPEGYIDDLGSAYAPQQTDLGIVEFGWVLPGTDTPAGAEVNARNRNTGTDDDALLKTFNIIGHRDSGQYPLREWLIKVPNGSYFVNISVGEQEYSDSNHVLDANGVTVLAFDQQNNNPQNLIYDQGTELVEVIDGTLRLSLNESGVNAKPNYIRLAPINTDLLPPTITASLDGLLFNENIYRGGVGITLSAEDRSSSGDIVRIEYTLDDMPVSSYTEVFNVTEVGSHTLYIEAEDAKGNIAVKTINFTIEEPTGALLSMENMTKVPGTDRGFPAADYYTFNRIGNPNTTGDAPTTALTHDTNTMRLNNNGTGTLVVSDIALSSEQNYSYRILSPGGDVSMPLSIAPGAYIDVELIMIGSSANGRTALLTESITVVSNADNGAEAIAVLNGAYAPRPEGNNEITAQEVFDVFGFTSSMRSIVNDNATITPPNSNPTRPTSNAPLPENIDAGHEGDLILSSNFVQADKSKPVYGIQLSALHGKGGDNGRFVAVNGTGTVGGVDFRHDREYYQSLLPKRGNQINADVAQSINGPFRIAVANYPSSGGNNLRGDRPDLLGLRIYIAKDRDGNVIPNEYIVLQDFVQDGCGAGSANCDWNDNTFYFINVRPEAEPSAQPIEAYAVNAGIDFSNELSIYYDRGYPGNKLTYSATLADGTPLPEWVTITEDGTLTGNAPHNAESSYTLNITATDLNGLSVSENAVLNINTAPIALISANVTKGAAPLEVEFSSEDSRSNGALLSHLWNFGNGETSEEENPVYIFEEIGDYEVNLTLTDEDGLTGTDTLTISVVEFFNMPPEAVAEADVTQGDAPLMVQFTGSNSTDDVGVVSYFWDFGNGQTSTEANPGLQFNEEGSYTVILTVEDEEGEVGVDEITINVGVDNEAPVAVIEGGPFTGNTPLDVFFIGNNSYDDNEIVSYVWDFGDGSFSYEDNPTHRYNSPGTYMVELTVHDAAGLDHVATQAVQVNATGGGGLAPVAVANADVSQGISPLQVSFDASASTDQEAISAYNWTIGGVSVATTPNFGYTFTEAGVYIVNLEVTNTSGLTDQTNLEIIVEDRATNEDFALYINAGSATDVNYENHTFIADQATPGIYDSNYTYTDPKAAETSLFKNERGSANYGGTFAYAIPVPNGTYTVSTYHGELWWGRNGESAKAGNRIFDILIEGNLVKDDFDIFTEFNNAPTKLTFSNIVVTDGMLNISLPASVDKSTISGIAITGTTTSSAPQAIVSATPRSGTAPLEVDFTGSNSVDDDGIVAYLWTFEDGVTSTEADPTYIFNEAGTYIVSLQVENADGLSDEAEVTIEVNSSNEGPVAQASASPLQGEAPLLVQFTGSNSTDEGILEYLWDFGDGTTSSKADPSHIYNQAGVYAVSLTVTDADGLNSTVSDINITVEEAENAEDIAIYLNTGSSATVDYEGRSFVGDVSLTDLYNSNHTYANTGASDVTLYQTERGSAENLTTLSYAIPVPNGTYRVQTYHNELWWGQGRAGGAGKRLFDILIEGKLMVDNFDIFQESNNSPLRLDFDNIIVNDGVLHIDLPASADRASISGLAIESVVNQKPVAIADATPRSGQAPLQVSFDGTGSTDDDEVSNYLWEFEPGVTTTEARPTYTFTKAGTYPVTLTVTDATGLSDQTSISINVSAQDDINDFALYINAGSATNVNYENHTFVADQSTPGIYNSDYTYSDPKAAATSLFKTERGSADYGGSFAYSIPVPNGTYTVSTYHGELYWGRNGGSAKAGNRIFDIFIQGNLMRENFDIYEESNNAPVKLTFYNIEVTDGSLNISLPASVDKSTISGIAITGATTNQAPVANIAATPQMGTAPLEVSFNSNTSFDDKEIVGYLWNFKDGSTSSLQNPKHVFTGAGFYEVSLTVTDGEGLSDTRELVINATGCNPVPLPWTSTDVGVVSAAGNTCFTDGNYNVTASGADIWGTSDEFHYAYRTLNGDGEIVARINTLSDINDWTKAGVMMRESTTSGSKHAFMLVAPNPTHSGSDTYGYAFQNRSSTNAGTASNNPAILPDASLPYYVRLVRLGNTFTGYISRTNGDWQQVSSKIISMNQSINVGLATTSHEDGTLAEAVYDNVQVINYNQLQAITAAPGTGKAPLEVDFANMQRTAYTSADLRYYWEFQDGTTSSEAQPTHTFEEAGKYQVSLTVLKGEDVLYQNTVDVAVDGDDQTALNFNSQQMRLYPNPAQSKVTLEVPANIQQLDVIRIFDVSGRMVKEIDAERAKNGTGYELDIESLEAGVYLLHIAGEEGTLGKQRLIVEY